MTEAEIIKILKNHEQLLYLPKGQRKNPLIRGVSRFNYKKVTSDILLLFNQLSTNKLKNMEPKTHPAHQSGPKLPTAGRIVHYFHNGADDLAAVNGADLFPAMVIQSWGTYLANIRVSTYSDGPALLRSSVPHKSEAVEGQPYWDWPEIK